MNAISKRLLSWLLVIAMVLSMTPVIDLSSFAVTSKADTVETHVFAPTAENNYTAWCEHCEAEVSGWVDMTATMNANTSYDAATVSAHWYLSGPVTKSRNGTMVDVETPNVSLCFNLNGQAMTNNGSTGYGFFVGASGAEINIMDTAGGAVVSGALYIGQKGGTFNIYGGTFSTVNTTYATLYATGGDADKVFNVYGGTITNNGKGNRAIYISNGRNTVNIDGDDVIVTTNRTNYSVAEVTAGTINLKRGTIKTDSAATTQAKAIILSGTGKLVATGGEIISYSSEYASAITMAGTASATLTGTAKLTCNGIRADGSGIAVSAGTVTLGGQAVVKNNKDGRKCIALADGAAAKLVIEDGWDGEAYVSVVDAANSNTTVTYAAGEALPTDHIVRNGDFTGQLYYTAAEHIELIKCNADAVALKPDGYDENTFAPTAENGMMAYCEHCKTNVTGWVDQTTTLQSASSGTGATANSHWYISDNVTKTNTGSTAYIEKQTNVSLCFNLNGYNITNTSTGYSFYVDGACTINLMDTGRVVEEETVHGTVTGSLYIGQTGGTINVYGGNYTTNETGSNRSTIRVNTNASYKKTFNLYGGTFYNSADNTTAQNVIYLADSAASVVIDGATVKAGRSTNVVYLNTGTITLKDGTIEVPEGYEASCVVLSTANAKLYIEGEGVVSTASTTKPAIAADNGVVTLAGTGSVQKAEGADQTGGINLASTAQLVIAEGWTGVANVYVKTAEGAEYALGETISPDNIYRNGDLTGTLYYGTTALVAADENAVKLPAPEYSRDVFEPWNQGGKAWCEHCQADVEGWVDMTDTLNGDTANAYLVTESAHWYITGDVTKNRNGGMVNLETKNLTSENAKICFNLNGCNVTNESTSGSAVAFFIGDADSEINLMDFCADATKVAEVKGALWIGNDGGTFNVYGGKYSTTSKSTKATLEATGGAFNLYDGTFTNNTGAGANVIKLAGADATIDGATVTTVKSNYTIANVTAGKLLLKSGKIEIDGTNYEARCVMLNGTNAVLEVTGGTISTNSSRSSAILIDANGGKVNLSGDAKVYGGTLATGNAIIANAGTVTLAGNATVKSAEGESQNCISLADGKTSKLVIAENWAGEAYVSVKKAVVDGETTTYVDYVAGERISTDSITREGDFTGKLYYGATELVKISTNAVMVKSDKAYDKDVFEPWSHGGKAYCAHCKTDVEEWVDMTSALNAATGTTGAAENAHWYVRDNVEIENANGSVVNVQNNAVSLCFNLNGYNVTNAGTNGYAFYIGGGTINLMDNGRVVDEETVYGTVTGSLYLGTNGGTFNVYGGTYTTKGGGSTIRTTASESEKLFNLKGGTFTNSTAVNQNVIFLNDANTTVVIDGATVTTAKNNYTIANVTAGTITLKSGEIKIPNTGYSGRCVTINGAEAVLNVEGGTISTVSTHAPAIGMDADGGQVNLSGDAVVNGAGTGNGNAITAKAGTVTLAGNATVKNAEGESQNCIYLQDSAKLVLAEGWTGIAYVYVQKAVVEGEETTYVDYARGETISTESITREGDLTGTLYYGDLALEAADENAVKVPPLAYNSDVFEPWNQGSKAWCDHCKDDIEGWVDMTDTLNGDTANAYLVTESAHWYITGDVTKNRNGGMVNLETKNLTSENAKICFNLNGCNVTNESTSGSAVAFFIGDADSEINLMDFCADATKVAEVKGALWIGNDGGTFNVYGGKYSTTSKSTKATLEATGGAFNLYDGTFTNNTGAGANVIKLAGADATIDGATVTTVKSNYTIANVTAGKLLLKSGKIEIDGTNYEARCVMLNGTNAVLEVTGGTISTNSSRSSAILIDANGGKVNLSGDAKVYGGTLATGNAIIANAGTVTLAGNATVKSAEGESQNCISLADGKTSKLVIAENWAGEAYVSVKKAVVDGETTTYVDYVAGENISTDRITRDADFAGKLYYKVGEENIVMVKASNNAVRIYKEYNENVFEPWLQDSMAHCKHCDADITGWVDVTSTLNAASGGTGATVNGTHWYVSDTVTKNNAGSVANVDTAGVSLCFNLNGQAVTNNAASGYSFYAGNTGVLNLMDTAGTAVVTGSLYIGQTGGTFNVYGGTYTTKGSGTVPAAQADWTAYSTIRTLGSTANKTKIFNLIGGTFTNSTNVNQNVICLKDAAATVVINGATVTTAKSNYTIANVLAGTITLKSGEIKINGTDYDARCVVLNGADAALNIEGGTISTNSSKRSAIYIDTNGGTVNMSGGIIDASQANNTNNAPTVAWLNGSRTVADGVITVNEAEFNMTGGTIYGGTTNYVGGAFRIGSKNAEGTKVSYANCAEFNMTGGLIDGGTAKSGDTSNCAGGIFYVAGNTVNIKGGTVKNGVATAKYGGIFALVAKSPQIEGEEPKAPAVLNISEDNAEVPTLIELGTAGTPDLEKDAEGYVSASGGIIFAAEYTEVNISGGTVKGGAATKEGGTIHAYYADVNISGDAKVYAGSVKEQQSHGINVNNGTVSVTGNAKVYGVGTTTGNAITAANATVTIGDNATIKNETGESNLSIYIAPTAKLVINDGWDGEAYIYAQKDADVDFKRGEAIPATVVELKGTYSGKLYYMNIQAFEVEGLATLGNARVMFNDGTFQWTNNEQAAIDLATGNAEAYAEIGTDAKLELKGENAFVYIDIDGHALEMTGTGTLYIMDKQNDDYEGAGSVKVGTGITVANEATNPANGNRYVALFSGNSWSAHRMELKLTTISLRTTTDGMYYKATIKCDDALGKRVTGFGTMLSLGSFPTALEDAHRYTSLDKASFKLNDEHTVNTTTCNLVNILKADNQGEENTWSMKQVVYANVYVGVDVMGDGHGEDDYDVVAYKDASEVKAMSLLEAVEYINKNWSTYEQALTPAAQANMKAFASKWLGSEETKYFDEEGQAAWQAATAKILATEETQ